jgi:predicted dehydrogenase
MSKKSGITRRDFIKKSTASGAGLAALGGISFITNPEKVFGANDRVRVAVVGIRGQGFGHIRRYAAMANVEVAALCDIDENVIKQRLESMKERDIPEPKTYTDYQKLLEDKSIDAVSIATPNHWHSLQGIWACQAGKDAYIEKPCSHTYWEGKQLVEACKRYDRIVSHGTNSRAGKAPLEAVKKINEGLIGDVYLSRAVCYKWRDTIGRKGPEKVPSGVDYELWTGPAPMKPFTQNRFHYNWHWIWDTGNGDLGNQGVHEMDIARWGLGVELPTKVSAIGGHYMFDDDQETPNTLNCALEFKAANGKKKMLEFELRHWITNPECEIGRPSFGGGPEVPFVGAGGGRQRRRAPNSIGNIFYGSNGYLAIGGYDSYKSWIGPEQEAGPHGEGGGHLWANFIDCVRSRKKENLRAPIREGHLSSALVHLVNISYKLGRTLNFDPVKEEVTGDAEANRMLRNSYRKPYIVPEKV